MKTSYIEWNQNMESLHDLKNQTDNLMPLKRRAPASGRGDRANSVSPLFFSRHLLFLSSAPHSLDKDLPNFLIGHDPYAFCSFSSSLSYKKTLLHSYEEVPIYIN